MRGDLDAAAQALDAGRPEETLARLEGVGGPDAGLLAAWAHLDLGDLAEARARLERTREGLPADDLDLCWLEAELLLREWRCGEARAAFERLLAARREPAWLDRLSLCLELQEDLAGADALLAEAARLDPQGSPPPARLSEAEFDRVVAQAADDLPDQQRRALGRCRLVIEPVPFPALLDRDDPGAIPPDLFGLFSGPDLHDLAEDVSGELPPTIYLFQRNLERAYLDMDALREEIRITLYHELGHLLGLDEDEVEAMGLG